MKTIILYRKPIIRNLGGGRYMVGDNPDRLPPEHVRAEYRKQCMASLVHFYANSPEATVAALLNSDFLAAVKTINEDKTDHTNATPWGKGQTPIKAGG